MDDTFLIMDKSEIDLVLITFNNYDINLKFTHEIEENNSISFLDVLVKKNNKIVTDWYLKSVYSGRVIHFKSSHLHIKRKILYIIW